MTVKVRAKCLRRGTYLVIADAHGTIQYVPVRRKTRRGGQVHVRGSDSAEAMPVWTFDANQVVEVLTADEQLGLGLPTFRRWWQTPQA